MLSRFGHSVFVHSIVQPDIKTQATIYGRDIEDINVKIKCPYCDKIISMDFDLKKCVCVFNPKIQKYEITHSIICQNCGNEVKNVTIIISRREGWNVS